MSRRKFQFLISECLWSLTETKNGTLVRSWSWKDLGEARSAVKTILINCPKSTIRLIFDNHNSELHNEDIPTVLNPIDRRNFVKRKLALTFNKDHYWTGYQLQVNSVDRNSKYPALFIGIERETQEAWFDIFEKSNVMIRSMVYAPIELVRLAKNLGDKVTGGVGRGEVLFLVLWERTHARICVYEQGYLVLTRLIINTTNSESETDTVFSISRECSNTIDYMRRLIRLKEKQVHLLLVVPQALIPHLPDNLIAPHNQTVFSLVQASSCAGLEIQPKRLEEKSHLLIHQALCDVSPQINLLPKKQRLNHRLSILERTLNPITAIALIGFAIPIAWNWMEQAKLKGLINAIDTDLMHVESSISRFKSQGQMGISWPEMEKILTHWDQGKKDQIDIGEWMIKLAVVINRFPTLQTQGLRVMPTTQESSKTNRKSGLSGSEVTAALSPILEWHMAVKPNFELDLRKIDDTLERLNEAVGQVVGVSKSEISKRPIDISPDTSLVWQDRSNNDGLLSAHISLTLQDPDT